MYNFHKRQSSSDCDVAQGVAAWV